MNQLNSSNTDSQGIIYSLSNSNGIRTAVITNQFFNTGRNIGKFAYFVGKTFRIQSLLHTNLYIDTNDKSTAASKRICMWNETGDDDILGRLWTIDEQGRLVSVKRPAWCVYMNPLDYAGSGRIIMEEISTLDVNDEKQYWGFDGTHIYYAAKSTLYWDLANGTNANGTTIALREGEYSDNRRHWQIVPDAGTSNYNTLTFKRGVMDANGVIYKLTGMSEDALTNNYSSIRFPQHKLSEFQNSGFPSSVSSVQFRDQTLT